MMGMPPREQPVIYHGTFIFKLKCSLMLALTTTRSNSFFFSQGFPSYLKKYCGNIPEELLDGSKEKSNVKTAGPRHVSVVFRDIDMKVDLSAIILPIFTSEESDNNDAPLIIRHVIILYHNHIHEVLLNEEAMQSFFARNGLCCSRLSFGSYICGREVIQGTDTRSCEALTIKITLKEVDSDSLLLEFAILQSLVQSPFVVFVDRGVIAPVRLVVDLNLSHLPSHIDVLFIAGEYCAHSGSDYRPSERCIWSCRAHIRESERV